MKLGISGSRNGMTVKQSDALFEFIHVDERPENIKELHHGDCMGVDAAMHDIARSWIPNCRIIIHPPIKTKNRAYKLGDVLLPEKEYKPRNIDIVNACDLLIAIPAGDRKYGGGTWHAISMCEWHKKNHVIIFRNGQIRNPDHCHVQAGSS